MRSMLGAREIKQSVVEIQEETLGKDVFGVSEEPVYSSGCQRNLYTVLRQLDPSPPSFSLLL